MGAPASRQWTALVLRAMAGVPLKSNKRLIGVLGLAFIEEGQLFDEERMAILTQFGELASVALDNAQLHDAVQRELSERRKAEERLRKLSVAVEQSPASIIIMDTDGTIEYVNPRFSELTGYSAAEAVGRNTRHVQIGQHRPGGVPPAPGNDPRRERMARGVP